MINFITIDIEGFKSIKHLVFDFKADGIYLLRGKNGNGKTTIFEALYWCLYGKCLKNTSSDKVPTKEDFRDSDFKGTRVTLEFFAGSDSYKIIRHLNYKGKTLGLTGGSKLMVYENDELRGDELHKNNQQDFINDIMMADANMFASSILYGQRMKKFIESSAEDKRTILADFFDVNWVDSAKDSAVTKLNLITEKITDRQNKINLLETSKKLLLTQQADELVRSSSFEETKKESIQKLEEDLHNERLKILVATKPVEPVVDNELISEYMSLQKSIEDITSLIELNARHNTKVNQDIKICESDLARYESTHISNVCNTCKGKLKSEVIQNLKDELDSSIQNCKSRIELLTNTLKDNSTNEQTLETLKKKSSGLIASVKESNEVQKLYNTELEKYNKINTDNKVIETNVSNIIKNIETLKESKFVKSTINFTEEIEKYEDKINIHNEKIKSLETFKTDFNWLIKTAFGAMV